jgi:NADPH2:quinone reductase
LSSISGPARTDKNTVNPHDQKIRDLSFFMITPPCILCMEIGGIIISTGPEVFNFKVGDNVFGSGQFPLLDAGGLQQYALLESGSTSHMPSGFSFDQAVTLPVNGIAAYGALFHSVAVGLNFPPPYPDTIEFRNFDFGAQSIVVLGGGSNMGKMIVQFASLAGFGKIVVVAGLSNDAELKSYGATTVINRHASNEEVKSQVQKVLGENVLYVLDAINTDHTLAVYLLSSTKQGKVKTLCKGDVDETRIGEKQAGYQCSHVNGFLNAKEALGSRLFKELPKWVEARKIIPLEFKVVEGGLNVEAVNKVLDDYRDGKNPGKWLVHSNA